MELLTLIENVDPTDTAAMDDIDRKTHIYVRKLKFYKGETLNKRQHGSWPTYTRSRDALKSIRPEGWVFYIWQGHMLEYLITEKHSYCEGRKFRTNEIVDGEFTCNGHLVKSARLPTEELAELYAIISAIQWERENDN